MSYPDIPHLAFPVRLDGDHFAAVEQDSIDDITQCVEVVLRTPVGYRSDEPDFGIPQPEFSQGDVDADAIEAAVLTWESRADLDVTEYRDTVDNFVDNLQVEVRGGTSG